MDDLGQTLIRCRTGDRAAYEAVVLRFYPRIVRLAWHLLGQQADAEEVAQDTFLQVFVQIRKLQDVRAFSKWLSRIATNLCMQRLRHRKLWSWLPLSPSLVAGGRDLAQVDARVTLSTALDRLTPPLRVVVLLRDILDHSYDEIAEILDIPEGTVKSRLNVARAALKGHVAVAEEVLRAVH